MPVFFLKRRFYHFLQEFIHDSRAIGILLLVCTVASLGIANSPWGTAFTGFFHHEIHWLHSFHLPHSALHFINDGLMAVFFFLVGMEIKRELVAGELSDIRQAVLPVAAAAGGMLVPAMIYMIFNKGTIYSGGWGIPTATDIAFSLGVASMLGSRFPAGLKVFLTALAIIDDLGAILVIAFFYGGSVKGYFLLAALVVVGLLYFLNVRKVRFGVLQIVLGLALWYLVFNSGLHATIAGVVFAFMVPAEKLEEFEMKLHNPVNFFILPVFALANTAIVLNGGVIGEVTGSPLGLGILAALVLGKPIGIVLACWLLVRNRMAILPAGINWHQMTGAGILAGIGFTMSIFIAGLAFQDSLLQDISKIAVLAAALLSIVGGWVWFSLRAADNPVDEEEQHD